MLLDRALVNTCGILVAKERSKDRDIRKKEVRHEQNGDRERLVQ